MNVIKLHTLQNNATIEAGCLRALARSRREGSCHVVAVNVVPYICDWKAGLHQASLWSRSWVRALGLGFLGPGLEA